METTFSGIIENIEKKNEENVAIYVAIGCASNRKIYDEEKKEWILKQKYNHGFPVCLQKLKTLQPWSPLHIIMIDPILEDPPFITMYHDGTKLDINWEVDKENKDIYHNDVSNIHVYAFRFSAVNICTNNKELLLRNNHKETHYDITDFLTYLNITAIEHKWFVLYGDYTGESVDKIATFFDRTLGDHRNHIVYGIGVRKDDGCYIDLTTPECNFYYTFFDKSIQVFNPYVYDKNIGLAIEIGKHIATETDDENRQIIISQIKIFLKTKIYFVLETVIEVFRQISYKLQNKEYKNISFDKFKYFEKTYDIDISIENIENNTDDLYFRIMDCVAIELKKFFRIFDSENEYNESLVNQIMTKMIEEKNVYNYQSIVRQFIDNVIKKIDE